MKFHTPLLAIAVLFLFHENLKAAALPLSEAIKQKKVSVTIGTYTPKEDSLFHPVYYMQCMQFEVKNLTATPLVLTESAGRFLQPDDSTTQRMIMSADVSFALRPSEKKIIPLYVMCSEAIDGAPSNDEKFSYGSFATGKLKELIAFVASRNYQNQAAQQAVWAITDHHSPYTIQDKDSTITNELRKFVCALQQIPYDPKGQTVYESIPLMREVHGMFRFTLQLKHQVDLKIFTGDEKLIKTLVDDEMKMPGMYEFSYDTSIPVNDPQNPPTLIIRFYLDGKLFAERKHLLSRG